jgi:hypothetical protein
MAGNQVTAPVEVKYLHEESPLPYTNPGAPDSYRAHNKTSQMHNKPTKKETSTNGV